ncbi:hypothetical protein H9Y05_10100 [Crocinitomicaceae bacterium CZZ-1]|uniref:Outer membrane protein beta-barrel domain-containing protein n=1 Tax=Taishania pollutisoli TaxID=2766479 RepID=A0A8J6PD15_9FLAO|nr:hypothetical protein [Taishania pollutisoli]MBC9812822.1 hypothetical protein [Taishania pollutisoli]MBX2949727.1 hypothetical protein [Crocinitomicaceae bacterium]NGF76147.1 hypothetical protein [Fluviicola sp. SGL-29]
MKYSLFILLFMLTPAICFNQKGFLSSKNMVDLTVHGNIPLLSGTFNDAYYKRKGDQMIAGKDYINYGVAVAYNRILTKQFGLGVAFSTKDYLTTTPSFYTNIYPVNQADKSVDSIQLKMEALKFRNYTIGPQFEFSTKQGILGIGFSYDLGLGVTISTLINDRYHYSINELYAYGEEVSASNDSQIDYFDTQYNWKPMYGISLQTGFKFRIPLSEHFSFYSGLRYSGTFMLKGSNYTISDRMELLDNEDYYYTIRRKNLVAISLNLGITCHF